MHVDPGRDVGGAGGVFHLHLHAKRKRAPVKEEEPPTKEAPLPPSLPPDSPDLAGRVAGLLQLDVQGCVLLGKQGSTPHGLLLVSKFDGCRKMDHQVF